MIGTFGGINEEAIHTVQSRFHILRCRQLAIRHQVEMDQGIVQNRRELMQVFIGFRTRHLTLLPEHIKGRIRLVQPTWLVGAGPPQVLVPASGGLADAAPGVCHVLWPWTLPPWPVVLGALRPCWPPAAERSPKTPRAPRVCAADAGRDRRSSCGHSWSRGRHGRSCV